MVGLLSRCVGTYTSLKPLASGVVSGKRGIYQQLWSSTVVVGSYSHAYYLPVLYVLSAMDRGKSLSRNDVMSFVFSFCSGDGYLGLKGAVAKRVNGRLT